MPEYARRATLAITLDGHDVAGDFGPFLLDFTYNDNASGKADEIQITLQNRDGRFINEWMPKKGMKMEAAIICADWQAPGETLELPCGSFSIDEIEFNGPPDKVSIKAVSADLTGQLRDSKKTRAWENMSLKALASQIASENGMELYYSGPEHRFERQDQRNEGDISFLNRLCGERSMLCKAHQGMIVVFDADEAEEADPSFTVFKTGGMYSPKSYSFRVSSSGTGYTDAEVAYCDPKTGTTHKAKVKSAKEGTDSRPPKTLAVQKRVENPEQAAEIGKSELHGANVKERTCRLEIMGCPLIASGQTIQLEDFGNFTGKYFINAASHSVSGQGAYTTSLELTTPAPTEVEEAREEKSEAAEAAKEEAGEAALDRRSGVVVYPPGQYPFSAEAMLRLTEAREKVNEFLILAQSGTEEERLQAERDWMIVNCLYQIAKVQVRDLKKIDKDDQGWLYLSDMLQFWLSGYGSNNADQNGEAFFVQWQWLYKFARVRQAYQEFIKIDEEKRETVLNRNAQLSLGDILFNQVEYKDKEEKTRRMKALRAEILPLYCREEASTNIIYFDFIHTNWRHWEALYYALKSVPGFSFGVDGLAAAMSSFTLRALAKGYAQKNGEKWRIHVEQVAVFGHDKFNFDESPDWEKDELGFWDCARMEFYIIPPVLSSGTWRRMNNGIFRNFRDRHGFGADFLVLSQLHLVENFRGYDYDYPK